MEVVSSSLHLLAQIKFFFFLNKITFHNTKSNPDNMFCHCQSFEKSCLLLRILLLQILNAISELVKHNLQKTLKLTPIHWIFFIIIFLINNTSIYWNDSEIAAVIVKYLSINTNACAKLIAIGIRGQKLTATSKMACG